MFKTLMLAVAAGVVLFAGQAGAVATEVDVAAYNSNYGNYGTPVTINLAAGSYQITFGYTGQGQQYQGWDFAASNFGQSNQGPAVVGCDANGANCSQGYVDSFGYTIGGAAGSAGSVYYTGPASNNGHTNLGQAYSTSAAAYTAFSNALGYSALTLSTANTVTFFVPDNSYNVDNYGGVTLLVTAVPEPSSLTILAFGLLGLGYLAHRRAMFGLTL